MCIPYIVPDPPQRKRPRSRNTSAKPLLPKDDRVKPTLIEISPRITYVASPKPDRSPLPPKISTVVPTPRRPSVSGFLEAFGAAQHASKQEESTVKEVEASPTKAVPEDSPPKLAPKAISQPPAPDPTVSAPSQQQSPSPPPSKQPPSPPQPTKPPTAQEPAPNPRPIQRRSPSHRSTRSPHSFIRRPPPHHPPHNRRPRSHSSSSSSSSISRQSFECMKRNINVLLDRIRAVETWKAKMEIERGRRVVDWEVGPARTEASMIRERREREREMERERERDRLWERERERDRGRRRESVKVRVDDKRWDWEGGGLRRR